MSWPDFIKDAKSKLTSHKVEVDPNEIWKNIEGEVDLINAEKRRRRPAAWWFWFGGIAVIAAGIFYLSVDRPGNEIYSDKIESQPSESVSDKSSSHTRTDDEIKKSANSTIVESTTKNKLDPESNKDEISTSEINMKNKSIKSRENRQLVPGTNNNKISDNAQGDRLKINRGSDRASANSVEATINSIENVPPEIISGNEKAPAQNPESQQHQLTMDDFMKANVQADRKGNSLQYDMLPGLTPQLLGPQQNLELKAPVIQLNEPYRRRKDQSQDGAFKLGVGLYGGLGYSPKSLSTNESALDSIVEIRDMTETTLETSQMGLNLTVLHMSGLELSLGVNRTRMVERFSYQHEVVETETVNGIQYYTITLTGDTVAVMGDVDIKRTTSINKEYYNRYTTVDLPVILGYRFNENNWVFGLKGGVIANLSLKTSGLIANGEDDFIDIGQDQDEVFKSNIGLGMYAAGHIGYMLTPTLELSLSPYYRSYGKTITRDGYGIRQKHATIGANLGLTFWIGQ